jgi:hypothetical protein
MGSNNYQKVRNMLARLHARIHNKRLYWIWVDLAGSTAICRMSAIIISRVLNPRSGGELGGGVSF